MARPPSVEARQDSISARNVRCSSEHILKQESGPNRNGNSPERRSVTSLYERSNLTTGQLQIWMGQNLLPEVPIYNLAVALNIHGEIEPVHFCRAFQALVNSSDALRTVVEEVDGIPRRKILPILSTTDAMSLVDLSAVPNSSGAAKQWMQSRCAVALDWRKCLFDATLIKLSKTEFIWYLNAHHFICDGWSFELIYRQMADLYRRSRSGHLPKTVELLPYENFVTYERRQLDSARHQRSEAYWKRVTSESSDEISFYGATPAKTTTSVQRISWDLGIERTNNLRSLARMLGPNEGHASLMQIFAAILVAYLHCLNGKTKYTLGVPFHNRRTRNFKETIGFFSEILPVSIDVSDEDSFASLIRKIKSEIFNAARHGQYSVVNPIFRRVYEVVLNYHTSSFSDFDGMPVLPKWIHNGHGDDSLAIQVRDFGASRELSVDFDLHQSIFREQDVQRVVAHFSRIMNTCLAKPEQSLRLLSLVSPEEAEQVLQSIDTGIGPPRALCVQQLIEDQAKQRPDAIAVEFQSEQLSYDELNRRANRVARYLRKCNIGPDTLVGVYFERSFDMIVGLLAILKAGAAYVPICPELPIDWVDFVLKDTAIGILLTHKALRGRLPTHGPRVVALDASELFSGESDENFESGATEDNLAYVIYTSGTTGTPKGVQITHSALTNFILQAPEVFELGPSDRVLQFASIGFDASVEEIFPCLTCGATLVLRTDGMLDSAAFFVQKCAEWRLTILDLPTAYWHELTARIAGENLVLPSSVRLVIIGGERVFPEKLALWRGSVGRTAKLVNTYGPTEATVTATVCDLTDYEVANNLSGEIPIGRALRNIQTYVLDQNLNPVPIGVPGELCIGGAGLARGYLNQPELTREKFQRNPFSKDSSLRLYRTGDRVRCRRDGHLEFVGRTDRQAKIRGFRVELDGIAATLRKHPLVANAVAVQDTESPQPRLVGFVVPKHGAVLNTADLKSFARKKLPEYMIPASIVALDSFPLTHSGKIDYRALPVSDASSQLRRTIVPPQGETECQLAELWREVLGLQEVSRSDHFFELGGDSLLALQVISRIRENLGVEIALRVVFEAPTLERLAKRVEKALRDEKAPHRKLVSGSAPPGNQVPISRSQARIWYMDQLAPDSAAYNIAAPIRFAGAVDKEALARTLNEMVRRHESLRTTFRVSEGKPVQIISPTLRLEIPEIDLRNDPEERRITMAKKILSEEAMRPFDLENGPLVRVLLLRLGDEDQVLFINMHHLISDQWSMGIIARETTALYKTFCQSASPSQPEPRSQYAEFAMWQEQGVGREDLEGQLTYWKTQLAAMEPLALPTDYLRPPVQTFRGARESVDIPTGLLDQLKRHAAHENATLYMVFLAAFKVLLCKYTGQPDTAVGSPVAGRRRLEWEEVIGTFVNILVLRTNISDHLTFREVLQRVRTVVLDAFTHGDVPFETLVNEVLVRRDPSRSPLIQVLFNFQSVPAQAIDLFGLSWMPFEIDQFSSQFDLGVTVDPQITRKIWIVYNTDLYKADTVGRMLRHYRRLLEAIAANPDIAVGAVSVMTDEERHQLVHKWNDSDVPFSETCVHKLFEAQARKTPDAIAAAFEDQQVSYEVLDQRASQIAHRLREMGVRPEIPVGICLERSINLVAGLLGILKAGGAYVPIDPVYPLERIKFMIEDSGMGVLLTEEKLLKHLPEFSCLRLLLDKEIAEIPTPESSKSFPPVTPATLAYIIYTSGSTGKPKGVEIEHRSLANFLLSMAKKPGMTERDVLLSVTTVSFDIAALELFLPLIVGARVVLAGRAIAADGRRLKELIEKSGATIMQATPTTWRMLTDCGWTGSEQFKILCGGEPFPLDLARKLLDEGNEVWNLYGPTETTVWSTICQIRSSDRRISIGKPIANTKVYIVDRNMEPVPIGVSGELCIGGQGVARGYLNRAELSAEKFVHDPHCGDSAARLFKTGDLARYLPDGSIECLGRIDHQLKIRGHRIEPEEIESVLRKCPSVREAVVVSSELAAQNTILVAYIVAQPDTNFDQDELRYFLKRKLPDYMIPSAFIALGALPLTPAGKVNRRALPDPGSAGVHPTKSFLAARDRLELQLAQIWQSVMNLNPIGIRDNFFELGGHSLTSVKLISEINKHFGVELPLTTIFAAATIEEQAKIVRGEGWLPPRNCVVEIRPGGSKPPLFLIGAGHRLSPYLEDQLNEDQPIYGLSFVGMFEQEIYPTTVIEIAASYAESIRSVQAKGPYYIAGYSSGGVIAFEVARALKSRGENVGLLALLDTYGPHSRGLPFFKRLPAHWSALKQRNPKEKLVYLLERIGFVALQFQRSFWHAFYRRFPTIRPVRMTPKTLLMVFDAAFQNYVPQLYKGRGVLLRAREPEVRFCDVPDRGWIEMFADGLEIHDVPGNHASILCEPHVQEVGRKLNECLRIAQQNQEQSAANVSLPGC
ncbi:MAG TPA: amino acid adenylation domain-containing protein [Candidatus Binatia bacterium]